MNFTTKVQIPTIKEGLTYKDKMLMLGSCFADEVGNWLNDYRFNIKINPFGTLYNPCSIANSVERLAFDKEFVKEDVINSHGIFTSFYHHSSISAQSTEEFLDIANKKLKEDSIFFNESDTIIITLGTAYIYNHISKNIIVSNCHKVKSTEFERKLLSVNECVAELNKIINTINSSKLPHAKKKIIFTVSPIRHLKDGAVENQISKATLLLAVAEVAKQNNINYFPAYEIMMDELRDYRFYAPDMVHPSPLAVEYIFEQFKDSFISPKSKNLMNEAIRITKAWKHRPLFPQSKEYQEFLKKLKQDTEEFNKLITYSYA